ncbi:acyl-CoA dehydrogenase [Mycolicibacterium thermoresistibile ATCC 19527]|uniref:Acyl-CoA dehydrogenase n=1 Tax=Mycolicibacterium thermoresistibile (strain ATCC 19527 / DSM 44167 / CIP 105390 / JCM 6362 / NCTC 10409 / 316) TaxID=1078020 RepID=G7CGB9_MYCT3|nr:acyl-CoA dehydrogenase [Mycolicibacterium thermoresistibile ATCC 19527]
MPEQFDTNLWHHLQESGLTRLTSSGDVEAGPNELAVVLAGIAQHSGAIPLAETDALAGWLGQRADVDLPVGPLTVAVADAEETAGYVRGIAPDVPWARSSAAVLLVARTADRTLVGTVDNATSDLADGHNLAGEPRSRLTFDIPVEKLAAVDSTLGVELWVRGAWCRCVQTIGTLDAVVAMSVNHTAERIQFGRTLSRFQSVQHGLAAMAGEIERARAAASLAVAAAADNGFESARTEFAVTAARAAVGRAVTPVTTIAHQLHGAIGVTTEHPLWSATMRARSWAGEFGTTNGYARRLGRMALQAHDPWDLVIGNI